MGKSKALVAAAMSEPVTFEELKKRWRKGEGFNSGPIHCANELESLEQRVRDVDAKAEKREIGIEGWLYQHAPNYFKEQEHLTVIGLEERPTREHIYWHYGYMVALKDIRRKLSALLGEPERREVEK